LGVHSTVFHWEFLSESRQRNKKGVLREKSPASGAELFMFWINQDLGNWMFFSMRNMMILWCFVLVVDIPLFKGVLIEATKGQSLFDVNYFKF